MKLTSATLRRIIKEELQTVLASEGFFDKFKRQPKTAEPAKPAAPAKPTEEEWNKSWEGKRANKYPLPIHDTRAVAAALGRRGEIEPFPFERMTYERSMSLSSDSPIKKRAFAYWGAIDRIVDLGGRDPDGVPTFAGNGTPQ